MSEIQIIQCPVCKEDNVAQSEICTCENCGAEFIFEEWNQGPEPEPEIEEEVSNPNEKPPLAMTDEELRKLQKKLEVAKKLYEENKKKRFQKIYRNIANYFTEEINECIGKEYYTGKDEYDKFIKEKIGFMEL